MHPLQPDTSIAPAHAWHTERGWRFHRVLPGGTEWDSLRALLRRPERAFEDPDWLKRGTTCSVVRVDLGDRVVVLKRYNLKTRYIALKRLFQPTRAARTWRVGQLMIRASVPTPPPLGYAEERIGPFRRRSYVVTEYVDGVDGKTFFEAGPADWRERIDELADLLCRMWSLGICHGDLKASNFLVSADGISFIDLDAAARLHGPWVRPYIEKDRWRIVRNWPGRPEIGLRLAGHLGNEERLRSWRT